MEIEEDFVFKGQHLDEERSGVPTTNYQDHYSVKKKESARRLKSPAVLHDRGPFLLRIGCCSLSESHDVTVDDTVLEWERRYACTSYPRTRQRGGERGREDAMPVMNSHEQERVSRENLQISCMEI